jgi:phasin family protein
MVPTSTQILEAQKSNVDALAQVFATFVQATEKLTQLNLEATRTLLQDGTNTASSLLGARDPQELANLANAAATPVGEKLAAYSRSVYGIASEASAELGRLVEGQVGDNSRKVQEAIDALARSAPAGSEATVTLLKNSLSQATVAFDTLAKAARAASQTAGNNFAAAVAAAEAMRHPGA